MSVLYIGSNSDKINSLRLSQRLSKMIAFNHFNTLEEYLYFIENTNSDDFDYNGLKCNISNNIVTFSKSLEEHERTLKNLWGFDYIIQIEETSEEFPIIFSSDLKDPLIINFFDFEKKLLEDNYLQTYNYTKDSYNTVYIVIKINPNFSTNILNELFFNISKNIKNISNYDRWFHTPRGWMKSKENSNYINKVIKESLFEDCLFYMDDSVEFKEGKTVFDRWGIVKTGKVEFDPNYPTFYNPHRFIFIPEGERVGISGWIEINKEWYYFNSEDSTGGDEKIYIDGIEYDLKLAKLEANYEDFYLDSFNILHHKIGE